mgnify:CR=1 FL=1
MFFAEYLFGRSERHTHTYTCNNETERKTMKKTKAENGYSVTEKVKTNFQAITPPLGANKKYKAHISKYLRHILK